VGNAYAKFHCAPLCIKKALGIFRELIPTARRTTTCRVAFWVQKFHFYSNCLSTDLSSTSLNVVNLQNNLMMRFCLHPVNWKRATKIVVGIFQWNRQCIIALIIVLIQFISL